MGKSKQKKPRGIYIKLMMGNFLFTLTTIAIFIVFAMGTITYFEYYIDNRDYVKTAMDLNNIDEELLIKHKIQLDEINQNGDLIKSYGEKLEEKEHYSISELIEIANKSDSDIKYKLIPIDNKDGEKIIILKYGENSEIDLADKNVITVKIKRAEKTKLIALLILFLMLTILISMFVVSKFIAKIITNPIHNMILGIEEFSKGNYSTRIPSIGNSELELIRDSLNDMAEKIESNEKQRIKDEEKRDLLIADISHDLKTPITSISGYARALNDGLVDDEEKKKKYLEYIYDKCQRMNYLIDQLFSFSKMDVISYELDLTKGNIGEFFKETIIEFLPDLDKKAFNYDVDIQEDLSKTYFDKDLLYRAFSNIILNAIKYNDHKTNMFFKFKKEENNYIFVIQDDGIGIPHELQSKIFDEFTRGDSARKSDGGSGLGLSITKKIVELHKGKIVLNSDKGKGSEFIITIPRMTNVQYFEYLRDIKEMKTNKNS